MKRNLLLFLALLLSGATCLADTVWMDVTTRFVKNPQFTNDSDEGWSWESNASTQAVRVECISFYNGHFDLHQQLRGLPKGRYRLSVQGFYRVSDQSSSYASHQNGSENITAFLYADNASKPLVSSFSASLSQDPGRSWTPDSRHYYPDGKEAALAAFQAGLYWNSIEFEAEDNVMIGVRCSDYQSDNYTVLDNFRLEYASGSSDGKAWIDMTDMLLRNPRFDNSTDEGWKYDYWDGTHNNRCESSEFWNAAFNIWQEVKDAPQGKYRLSVQSYYRTGDNNVAYSKYKNGTENITAYMYGADKEQKLVSIYSAPLDYNAAYECWEADGKFYPNTMESARVSFDENYYWNYMEFEAGGNFLIGLRCEEHDYSSWCMFDNFRLEYYGDIVKVSGITVSAPYTQLIIGETLQLSAIVAPANATMAWVEWATSNEKVATISQDGTITATGKGTVTITAMAMDGTGVKGTLTLTVMEGKAEPGSLIVNEIMVSNIDEFISPAFNFDGWIELYNPTDHAVGLAGLQVSDPANGEGPWTMPVSVGVVPAKGFRTLWFDSNDVCPQNAPFSLDTDGGTLLITTGDGTEIVKQAYPASVGRTSYARTTDGGETWGTTATPTPGESNKGIKVLNRQLAAPVVNQPSQLFSGQLSISVDIPAGTTLRYTTDGSLPTEWSEWSQNGQFQIDYSTCFRFRLFASDALPSPVTTRSYIYRDQDYYLPVVSVVSDWDFLYSEEIGVMTTGPNGRPGNGSDEKCNWNMNWERPVNFSYLDANGEMVLNQDVNLEMCGGWSRAWWPHAFKLKGSKELSGDKNLLYSFFSQKPYICNRTLQIRNGGNDTQCRFKDPALQYIIQSAGVNLDCQSYEPVHEFINGQYVGVLNVREPNNKHYVYANYGWDDDEIEQFEMSPDSAYIQKCGTKDAWDDLVTLSADAANTETYDEICRLLDVDAYANYMAAEFYLGNWDWPQNNVKGFRHRDNGKFRFVYFDLDGSFSTDDPFNTFMGKETYTFDQLRPSSLGPRIRANIQFVTLFKNMLKNEQFRRQFIDAYCIMGGSVYEKKRAEDIVNQLFNRVEPAMNIEWGSAANTANDVKNRLNSRLTSAVNALKNYGTFNLRNTKAQRMGIKSTNAAACLFLNGQQIPTGSFEGQLFQPLKLRAEAPAGYVFTGWYDKVDVLQSANAEMSVPSSALYLEARFKPLSDSEKLAQGVTPVCINEISGSNDSYINEYGKKGDWVELYNTTDKEIDVEGMYLTDNLDKPTKYQISKGKTQANTKIPAHGYLIVWCDKRETTSQGLHASFKIDGDGGFLQLMAADKSWKNTMSYGAHDARTTVVRFPDGTPTVYTSNVTTIGQPNMMTSYMAQVDQTTVGIKEASLISAANGFRLRYGDQQLLLRSDDGSETAGTSAQVSIYTPDGQLVEQAAVTLRNGTARLSVAHLPAGFYVARAVNADHTAVSCKFMK